jgi:hypothetical protein
VGRFTSLQKLGLWQAGGFAQAIGANAIAIARLQIAPLFPTQLHFAAPAATGKHSAIKFRAARLARLTFRGEDFQ